MNAASRKVLQEVLTGLLITESNVKRSRIRRKRCPRMKRSRIKKRRCPRGFRDGANLRLGAICRLFERKRERHTHRRVPINNKYQKEEKRSTYA